MRGFDGALRLFVAAAACAAALAGCASKLGGQLHSSRELRGADGQVQFSRTPDDNIEIDLTVKHLRDPEKIEPPAWAYVAWIRSSKDSAPVRLGPLNVSKDLTGELRTVTQLRTFDLFVTAEPSAAVEQPSGEPLLWKSRYE